MQVTIIELTNFVLAYPELLNQLSGDNWDDYADELRGFITSMSQPVFEHHKTHGLFYDEATDAIIFDPAQFEPILNLSHQIIDAYDSEDIDGVWDKWDLSGDDDVDYNGSYILIIVGILEAYADLS